MYFSCIFVHSYVAPSVGPLNACHMVDKDSVQQQTWSLPRLPWHTGAEVIPYKNGERRMGYGIWDEHDGTIFGQTNEGGAGA